MFSIRSHSMFGTHHSWAITMRNIFSQLDLSVAQITVLCVLMLQAHNLPIESTISKAAGVSYLWTISLRIFSAVVMGYFLHIIYSNFGLLTEGFTITMIPTNIPSEIYPWILYQIKVLL